MKARLLLPHSWNKTYLTEHIMLKRTRGNCSNKSDQESDDSHSDKSQENLCFGAMIIHIKINLNHTPSTLHQVIISCISNGFSSVQKNAWGEVDELRPASVRAVQPDLPLIPQDSFLWWVKRMLYGLWSCRVLASHALQHCSSFQTAIIKKKQFKNPTESKQSH